MLKRLVVAALCVLMIGALTLEATSAGASSGSVVAAKKKKCSKKGKGKKSEASKKKKCGKKKKSGSGSKDASRFADLHFAGPGFKAEVRSFSGILIDPKTHRKSIGKTYKFVILADACGGKPAGDAVIQNDGSFSYLRGVPTNNAFQIYQNIKGKITEGNPTTATGTVAITISNCTLAETPFALTKV